MDSVFTIATNAASNQISASAMYKYASEFFSGTLDPAGPHAVLILVSVTAGIVATIGIISESKKLFSIPTMLIVVGVLIESACTILLFGFDEGISRHQSAQLLAARQQAAIRDITPEETREASAKLGKYSGQSAKIVVFPVNFESVWIAQAIYGILLNARWKVDPPEKLSTAPGDSFMVQGIWVDHSDDDGSEQAAKAARDALNSTVAQASGRNSGPGMIKGVFDPTKPMVWILIGDKPIPLRSWVKE
jgi:hypothetical protein